MIQNEYIKQFEDLDNKRFSVNQSVSLFYGLVFMLLGDKKIFKKNMDINEFIEEVFSKKYKEYLFSSRPYLSSRVLNDIKKEKNYTDIIELSKKIVEFLENKESVSSKDGINDKSSYNKDKTDVIGWIKHIQNSGDKKQ